MPLGQKKGIVRLSQGGIDILFEIIDIFYKAGVTDDVFRHALTPLSAQFDIAQNIIQFNSGFLEFLGGAGSIFEFILEAAEFAGMVTLGLAQQLLILA
jgi:hypothetical protein